LVAIQVRRLNSGRSKTVIRQASWHVRFVPPAAIGTSFDRLVAVGHDEKSRLS
jgi:hypothetical protein